MIYTKEGAFTCDGTGGEIFADYAVITGCLYKTFLDNVDDEEEALDTLMRAFVIGVSDKMKKEIHLDEEEADDPLTRLVRDALKGVGDE